MTEAEEVGFVQAVCTAPDDDLPRLAYADWLEEHGRADRAAFIRRQVKTARLKTDCLCGACVGRRGGGQHHNGPCAAAKRDDDGVVPYREEDRLWAVGGVTWGAPLGGGSPRDWERGFLATVRCTAAQWLEHAAALYWRPGATATCDECLGKMPTASDCPNEECEDGRVPKPCPVTAQPIERVLWSTLPAVGWEATAHDRDRWRRCHIAAGQYGETKVSGVHTVKYLDTPTAAIQRIALTVAEAEWPGVKFSYEPAAPAPRPRGALIADLPVDTLGYTVPWAVLTLPDARGRGGWIRGDYTAYPEPGGTVELPFRRTERGVHIARAGLAIVSAGRDGLHPFADRHTVAHALRHWRMLPIQVV